MEWLIFCSEANIYVDAPADASISIAFIDLYITGDLGA